MNDVTGRHWGYELSRQSGGAVPGHSGRSLRERRSLRLRDPGVSEWTISGTTVDGERVEVRGRDLPTFGPYGKIVRKDSFWKIRDT
jgi:hypothetical protein